MWSGTIIGSLRHTNVLKGLRFIIEGLTIIHYENTANPTERNGNMVIQHFTLNEWVGMGQVVFDHIIIHLSHPYVSTKALGWVPYIRYYGRRIREYTSYFMNEE